MKKTKTQHISMRLPAATVEQIKTLSRTMGTQTQVVIIAIDRLFDSRGKIK